MSTNKQDWMIDPFAVTNFLELPLRVAKELMDMTAKASNSLSFESIKKKHPTSSANIFGFHCTQFIIFYLEVKFCFVSLICLILIFFKALVGYVLVVVVLSINMVRNYKRKPGSRNYWTGYSENN